MSAKNKLWILLLVTSFFASFTFAQPIVKLWDKTIGGNKTDISIYNMLVIDHSKIVFNCVSQSDSGFDKSQNNYKFWPGTGTWLYSLDKNGNKLWDKVVGGDTLIAPTGMVMENNNSFYLTCGISYQDTAHDITAPITYPTLNAQAYPALANFNMFAVWLLNFDSSGDKLSNYRYGADKAQLVGNNLLLDSTSLLLTGEVIDTTPSLIGDMHFLTCNTLFDLFVTKINLITKQVEWSFNYGGLESEYGITIKKGWNNNYLIGGKTSSSASCSQSLSAWSIPNDTVRDDILLLSIDGMGNIKWQKHFGGLGKDDIREILKTDDGGYLLYGESTSAQGYDVSQSWPNTVRSLWVLKIDSLGNKIWDKRYGSCVNTTLNGASIINGGQFTTGNAIKTSDGGYMFVSTLNPAPLLSPCGDVSESGRGNYDYWILKTDINGNKLWDKTFGSPSVDAANSIVEIDTGIYVVGGSSVGGIGGDKTEVSRGSWDLWLVCFADTTVANITSVNEIYQANSTLFIWPNPANDILNYTLIGNEKIKNITITNMLGEKVLEVNTPTNNTIQINNLQSGVYLFKYESTTGKRFIKKVMVKK